jgi:ATP-dependent DNA helicase RecG
MEEMQEVHRVVAKRIRAPHETLLCSTARSQNARAAGEDVLEAVPSRARGHEARRTRRGGVVVPCTGARLPVKFIGVGEGRRPRAVRPGAFARELPKRTPRGRGTPHRVQHPRRTAAHAPARRYVDTRHLSQGRRPARALALAKLGVIFARDLLYHVPHRYEDASTVSRIADLEAGMDGTVIGSVISKGVIPTRKGLRIFQAVVKDASGMMEVSWPGQPFLDRTISKGDVLLLTGTVRFFHGRQLQPREFVNLGAEEQGTGGGRVLSVYPATEGLSFKQIRTLVDTHLDVLLPQVREPLPPDLLALAGVPPLPDALRMVHRPSSIAEALEGRSRLAFEELLCVHILHRRANALARERRDGIAFVNRRDLTTAMKSSLPFELTGAQTRALREIVVDMTSERRMHRLLQGDVGSGKTIVALFACLLAMENGWQAAVMAPTELLAEQHQRTFSRLLAPMAIRPMLVTGRLPARERREAAERMERPAPLLVVGTHALVQQATQFARLGFAAIDEQHRFGVEQRKALSAKGRAPDVLLMSATPIPRSLALTLYGDLT